VRRLAALFRVGHLVGTAALTFVLLFVGIFGHAEITRPGSGWHADVDAWQWDAILVLGLAGGVSGVVFFATRLVPALAAQAVLVGAGVGLVLDAEVVSRIQLALGLLATIGAGAVLVFARHR
jgi:hypothetical protein